MPGRPKAKIPFVFIENIPLTFIINGLAGNIILAMRITSMRKGGKRSRRAATVVLAIVTLIIPIVVASLIHFDIPLFNNVATSGEEFVRTLSAYCFQRRNCEQYNC